MEKRKQRRKINAARICFGISRIGYTPASAICDIIDNSVSANAKNIHIEIIEKNASSNPNRKNNIQQYLIIDDGDGMNKEKIGNALDLGSSKSYYSEETLSKFGLGLKSASFAQGSRLEIISGDGSGEIYKEYVDLEEIDDDYFSVECDLDVNDKELTDKYFDNKRGTIIRISKIYTNNHPSIKTTMEELKNKLGVIYYYFLKKDLHIFINGKEIDAIDVLFTEEAGDNNLDENEWNGKSVQWILKPFELILDPGNNIKGKIEITMLPHPKVRKNEGIKDFEIRDKYHISANNYGFYIYRNGRLINWANRLEGIIPQDVDYYAFRGRINIQSDADDAFNIDVSKSRIALSEDTRDIIGDFICDYKRKCKEAWKNAYAMYNAQNAETTNEISNNIAYEVGDDFDDLLLDDDNLEIEEERRIRKKQIIDEMRLKETDDTIKRIKNEDGREKTSEQITQEEIAKTMKGSSSISDFASIFKVSSIVDNLLWEPYVNAETKQCVRISTQHRFAKLIYESNCKNQALQVLFELGLLISAKAELDIRRNYWDNSTKQEQLASILYEYRRIISENLAKLCRRAEEMLPSDQGE